MPITRKNKRSSRRTRVGGTNSTRFSTNSSKRPQGISKRPSAAAPSHRSHTTATTATTANAKIIARAGFYLERHIQLHKPSTGWVAWAKSHIVKPRGLSPAQHANAVNLAQRRYKEFKKDIGNEYDVDNAYTDYQADIASYFERPQYQPGV